jgi:hypothetical protein
VNPATTTIDELHAELELHPDRVYGMGPSDLTVLENATQQRDTKGGVEGMTMSSIPPARGRELTGRDSDDQKTYIQGFRDFFRRGILRNALDTPYGGDYAFQENPALRGNGSLARTTLSSINPWSTGEKENDTNARTHGNKGDMDHESGVTVSMHRGARPW